jgi:hypothetical protein
MDYSRRTEKSDSSSSRRIGGSSRTFDATRQATIPDRQLSSQSKKEETSSSAKDYSRISETRDSLSSRRIGEISRTFDATRQATIPDRPSSYQSIQMETSSSAKDYSRISETRDSLSSRRIGEISRTFDATRQATIPDRPSSYQSIQMKTDGGSSTKKDNSKTMSDEDFRTSLRTIRENIQNTHSTWKQGKTTNENYNTKKNEADTESRRLFKDKFGD